jgi:DNA-binding CsgD family transcriptional regulator
MKKPKDANQLTLWRFIAITMCLIWVVSFLLRVFVLGGFDREHSLISMPIYIGFCAFTVGMLIVLLIFPYQFYLYAAFCWIWGLARLVDGGGLSALLVHLISYMFLYRQGFFNPKARRWITIIIGGVMLAVTLVSQIRFGRTVLLMHLLQLSDFVLAVCVAAVVLRQEIRLIQKRRQENILRLPADVFSGEDAEILRRILAGEKYEAIAHDAGQSLSTLKKHVRGIFLKLEVNDRIVFMSRYANHRIVLEAPDAGGPKNETPPAG